MYGNKYDNYLKNIFKIKRIRNPPHKAATDFTSPDCSGNTFGCNNRQAYGDNDKKIEAQSRTNLNSCTALALQINFISKN